MEEYMVWIWLAIFILAIIIESISQDLIAIWFGLGAVISLILSAFPSIPWYIEVVVFAFVSLLVMILTRPLAKRLLLHVTKSTNVDDFVGKKVKVISPISEFKNGEVKINDIIYHASLQDNVTEEIPVGEIVEIIELRGNKVIVKKIN